MSPLAAVILQYVSSPGYQPVKPPVLAQLLEVSKPQRGAFRAALEELLDRGQVVLHKNGLIRPATARGLIVGRVRKTSRGFGFLAVSVAPTPENETPPPQELFIAAEDMRDAQNGDEVEAQQMRGPGRFGLQQARVTQVLNRATSTFVGTYFERNGRGYVQVDGTALTEPIAVGDPGAKGAQPNDKVVLEMLRFPSAMRAGEGVLTKVLGARGATGVDTAGIIYEFGLPQEFSPDALDEARLQADLFSEEDLRDRVDLTADTIVTIDPHDARDFDDAISLTRNSAGHWQLGVHIADVSHFVRQDSPLDLEARQRATSIYLPDLVIPMLPEVISNGLASLQQGVVRYTVSAFLEFTAEGVPVSSSFAKSAIRVTQRFAYEQVFAFLNDPAFPQETVTPPVAELLKNMQTFARILRKRRFQMGALELDLPEVKIDLDKEGRVSGAHQTVHDESHQIIEEFMLAANFAVATELSDQGLPFLRRVHAAPDELKMRKFAQFVTSLGFELPKFQSRTDIQALIRKVAETPLKQAVNYALLRSLKQAKYSAEEGVHYALAADDYCHFTSPIRRYPDLVVHRLIRNLPQQGTGKSQTRDPDGLHTLAEHCSAMERRAESAERELIKIKLLTYMEQQVGQEFNSIITSVQEYGLFCQGVEIPVEGLLHITDLPDDFYDYSEQTHSLVGRRKGREFRLGQALRVVVARVDIEKRQLDYRLPRTGTGNAPATIDDAAQAEASARPTRREGARPPRSPRQEKQAPRSGKPAQKTTAPKGKRTSRKRRK